MTALRKGAFWLALASAWLAMATLSAAPAQPSKVKPAAAVKKPAPGPAAPAANVPFLPGAGSKEPVSIDAGKLDYFDKEQKLVYTDDVVAVQGESTLKASVLTIYLQKQDAANPGGATAPAPAPAPGPGLGGPGQGSSVRHMEAQGPVTLISKDQIGTGDSATYDKAENKVYLNGNVTLSQGTNVTQGDRLIYDLTNGQAQVFAGDSTPRVKSVFTPGSGGPEGESGSAKAADGDPAKKSKSSTSSKKPAPGKTAASGRPAGGARSSAKAFPDTTAEQ